MRARIVEETGIQLKNKLAEHEKGNDFINLFKSLMNVNEDVIKDALYYVSDRGDWGEGAEVVDVYFVNPLTQDMPDAIFLGSIRDSFLPKYEDNVHLSESTRAKWSKNLSETVKSVYSFTWAIKFKFVHPVETQLSENMEYFVFQRAVRAMVKEEFIEFFKYIEDEERYHTVKNYEVQRDKVLLFLVGDQSYQAVMFIQSLFQPESIKPLSRRILEESNIYNYQTVGDHM